MNIYQNRSANENIYKYGCNFTSIINASRKFNNKIIHYEDIKTIYDKAIEEEWMKEDCTLWEPQEVFNYTSKLIGGNKKCYHIGSMDKKGNKTFIGWVRADKRYQKISFTMIKYYQNDESKFHFCLGDIYGILEIDPWFPKSESAQLNKIKEYYLYYVY